MLKYLIFGLLIAFVCMGNAIAGQQHDLYIVTPQEAQQMAKNRQAMTKDALAPALNEKGEWKARDWMLITSNSGVTVKFQKLGYLGCGYVHLEKTGYVPVCNYRSIYDMLVSKDRGEIDDAITLVEIYAMHAGLIPYGEFNEREDMP